MSGRSAISCLFVTYNRSHLLKTTIGSLRRSLAGSGIACEFVVADDHSECEHLEVIRSLGVDVLTRAEVNGGLGANCNRGIAACTMPLILQVQDDWEFTGTADDIHHAADILKEDSEIGIVEMTAVGSDLPIEERQAATGRRYRVYANDHLPWRRRNGLRPYSDRPHLKSRRFVDSIGRYLEGVPMAVTELEFQKRVANQSRWRVATIAPVFRNNGEAMSLNPGLPPSPGKRLLDKVPLVKSAVVPPVRALVDRGESALARGVYRLRQAARSSAC